MNCTPKQKKYYVITCATNMSPYLLVHFYTLAILKLLTYLFFTSYHGQYCLSLYLPQFFGDFCNNHPFGLLCLDR
ncbi:hypothetical protein L249_4500 [Ophiocordyceps polyrhachis-furcata BCC 54312]|uniref:Uncharacterized protein n=1 Tax=Ophiocordyceps polyrhachis-furcata BCC 54312 TaxID=1330021 RepID=A0A367KZ09_9HYPO|nr:hypothetical protein L249_4500 [Ophiocordyceps polyrhachis-furcata BCC 54312]